MRNCINHTHSILNWHKIMNSFLLHLTCRTFRSVLKIITDKSESASKYVEKEDKSKWTTSKSSKLSRAKTLDIFPWIATGGTVAYRSHGNSCEVLSALHLYMISHEKKAVMAGVAVGITQTVLWSILTWTSRKFASTFRDCNSADEQRIDQTAVYNPIS